MPQHVSELPAKKQSKWSPDEDALIIALRGNGMKWEDISKRLPGRSAISCRLHYQNYLERRSEWDEERKNKLARLYERFKPEMWARVAEEMAVPWRAAEAMHWQLGESDMARRAGVVPFSLSSVILEAPTPQILHRRSPSHRATHSQHLSQGNLSPGSSTSRMTRSTLSSMPLSVSPQNGHGRTIAARRGSDQINGPSPLLQQNGISFQTLPAGGHVVLADIGPMNTGRRTPLLPSLAELTDGVSPYNTPTLAVTSPSRGEYLSPVPPEPTPRQDDQGENPGQGLRRHEQQSPYGAFRPSSLMPPTTASSRADTKRRASPPELNGRETSRRRQ